MPARRRIACAQWWLVHAASGTALTASKGSWRGRHAEAAELSRAVAGSAVALGSFLCCGWAMDGADAVAGRDPAGLESEASPGRKRSSSLNPCHRRPRLQLAVSSEECREEACYYLLPEGSHTKPI